jgi:hypothetical protein
MRAVIFLDVNYSPIIFNLLKNINFELFFFLQKQELIKYQDIFFTLSQHMIKFIETNH